MRLLPGIDAEALSRAMSRTPTPAPTAADYSFDEARRELVGRDAILREGPLFGRTGLIKGVIADAEHGFLVLVMVYKHGTRVMMDKPPPDARAYWPPGKVQVAP